MAIEKETIGSVLILAQNNAYLVHAQTDDGDMDEYDAFANLDVARQWAREMYGTTPFKGGDGSWSAHILKDPQ